MPDECNKTCHTLYQWNNYTDEGGDVCWRRHDLNILFVQEVTSREVLKFRGYENHLNIGTSIRGTAILARRELHLTNITTLPSGRAIAAVYKGIQLINVHVPSGTAKRTDREGFLMPNCHTCFKPTPNNWSLGVISTAFCTPVTPQVIWNLAGPSWR